MLCYTCAKEPAKVGLLCQGCVEDGRARAQQSERNVRESWARTATHTGFFYRYAVRWDVQLFAVVVLYFAMFISVFTSQTFAGHGTEVHLLVAGVYTSLVVQLITRIALWMKVFSLDTDVGGGLFALIFIMDFFLPIRTFRYFFLFWRDLAGIFCFTVVSALAFLFCLFTLPEDVCNLKVLGAINYDHRGPGPLYEILVSDSSND